MRESDELYFLRFEHRPLSPDQWEKIERYAISRAQAERAEARRRVVRAIAAGWRAAARGGRKMAAKWGNGFARWRERRAAVRGLSGLDDRTLKDLGLHRSEIESVIYGRECRRIGERKFAATLLHKPYTPPPVRRAPGETKRQARRVGGTAGALPKVLAGPAGDRYRCQARVRPDGLVKPGACLLNIVSFERCHEGYCTI